MVSKESLEHLLYYATLDDSGFEPYMESYADDIKKDLELLNIIKKYLAIKGSDDNKYLAFENISSKKNKKDFNKIEEWLNEK